MQDILGCVISQVWIVQNVLGSVKWLISNMRCPISILRGIYALFPLHIDPGYEGAVWLHSDKHTLHLLRDTV